MAPPRDCFCAHQRARFRFCEPDGAGERGFKFGSLHVVRESAESRIAPAEVGGVFGGMSQAAEFLEVRVSDSEQPNDSASDSRLNWGLCRERGIVRTSITRLTPCAFKISMNCSIGLVECPIVNTSNFFAL